MDLFSIDGKIGIHIMDAASRFSRAAFLPNKRTSTVVDRFITLWFDVFRAPERILSDPGGEFDSALFRRMCERLSVYVNMTSGEAPWSLGLLERANALIKETYRRVEVELPDAPPSIVLAKTVQAKNALANV